jgi:hypothetical protein
MMSAAGQRCGQQSFRSNTAVRKPAETGMQAVRRAVTDSGYAYSRCQCPLVLQRQGAGEPRLEVQYPNPAGCNGDTGHGLSSQRACPGPASHILHPLIVPTRHASRHPDYGHSCMGNAEPEARDRLSPAGRFISAMAEAPVP